MEEREFDQANCLEVGGGVFIPLPVFWPLEPLKPEISDQLHRKFPTDPEISGCPEFPV